MSADNIHCQDSRIKYQGRISSGKAERDRVKAIEDRCRLHEWRRRVRHGRCRSAQAALAGLHIGIRQECGCRRDPHVALGGCTSEKTVPAGPRIIDGVHWRRPALPGRSAGGRAASLSFLRGMLLWAHRHVTGHLNNSSGRTVGRTLGYNRACASRQVCEKVRYTNPPGLKRRCHPVRTSGGLSG